MEKKKRQIVSINSKYNGSLTREQFLFHEMRITAKLLNDGLTDEEAINKIIADNLFQYPTERQIKNLARVCINRLNSLGDKTLVSAIATQSSEVAKQICLYSMMKYNRLVWDFMITVVGDKFKQQNLSFSKIDVNAFFMRLQEQDDNVSTWAESTVKKIKQVLVRILVENNYLDNTKSDHLNPVLIYSILENSIRNNNDTAALSAFNCL
ncbi:DUF1819 family protein [Ruminococcus sp.]|uniref:DUF1819 family protein n=1 Tax=Ruminococcus sp. TaxID=41978 RepID=UPI0025D04380|nr:DUF1819 family protein [Ruminococcus sp.]